MNNSIITTTFYFYFNEIMFFINFEKNLPTLFIFLRLMNYIGYYLTLKNLPSRNVHRLNYPHMSSKTTLITSSTAYKNIRSGLNKINSLIYSFIDLTTVGVFFHTSHLHHNYKQILGFTHQHPQFPSFNLFSRFWLNGLNFIMNIFFFSIDCFLFGSSLNKKEVSALNWSKKKIKFSIWKYYYPLFFLKSMNFNHKVNFFFKKFSSFDINLFFIIDTNHHFKNLYYFNKYQFYTIGLIDYRSNPYLLSFPLPTLLINDATQFMFLNWISYSNKCSNKALYELKKKWWYIL